MGLREIASDPSSDMEYCLRQIGSGQWWRKLPTESNKKKSRPRSEQRAAGGSEDQQLLNPGKGYEVRSS